MADGHILDLYTVKIYEAGILRGEMRREEYEEEWEKEIGRREVVFNLVKKNKLSEADGAEALQMTSDEFKEAMSAFFG